MVDSSKLHSHPGKAIEGLMFARLQESYTEVLLHLSYSAGPIRGKLFINQSSVSAAVGFPTLSPNRKPTQYERKYFI